MHRMYVEAEALVIRRSTYVEAVCFVLYLYGNKRYGLRLASAAMAALRRSYMPGPAGGYTQGGIGRAKQ